MCVSPYSWSVVYCTGCPKSRLTKAKELVHCSNLVFGRIVYSISWLLFWSILSCTAAAVRGVLVPFTKFYNKAQSLGPVGRSVDVVVVVFGRAQFVCLRRDGGGGREGRNTT